MAKVTQNPKKYIISCRLDDREMQMLQEIAKQQAVSITTLVRQSLNLPERSSRRQAG